MTRAQTDRRSDAERGFTLIELLVVVAIIGIVAAIAVVAVGSALDKAKQRATMADIRTVGRAIEAYQVDHGFLPSDAGGILGVRPFLIPYQINVLPVKDHWLNTLAYTTNGSHYTVESFGKDGIDGADLGAGDRFDYSLDIVLADGMFAATPE